MSSYRADDRSIYLSCTQNHSRNIGVAGSPCQSELGSVATKFLGNGGKLPDLLDLGFAFGRLELLDSVFEERLVGGEARVLRDAIVVLAGQEATCEGTPDSSSVLELLEQDVVLGLEPLAVEPEFVSV